MQLIFKVVKFEESPNSLQIKGLSENSLSWEAIPLYIVGIRMM